MTAWYLEPGDQVGFTGGTRDSRSTMTFDCPHVLPTPAAWFHADWSVPCIFMPVSVFMRTRGNLPDASADVGRGDPQWSSR